MWTFRVMQKTKMREDEREWMTEITITKTSASKEVSTERREQLPEMISDVPLPRSKQLPSALAWIINAIPKNTEWSREHRTLKKSGKFKSLILSTIYVNSYYVQRKINNIHKLKVLFLQFLARKSSANIFWWFLEVSKALL